MVLVPESHRRERAAPPKAARQDGSTPCAPSTSSRAPRRAAPRATSPRPRRLAKEALDQGVRAHGERHAALVPFLLVYAGLLNQCQGWAAGKPFYDRAQRLRALVAAPRLSPR